MACNPFNSRSGRWRMPSFCAYHRAGGLENSELCVSGWSVPLGCLVAKYDTIHVVIYQIKTSFRREIMKFDWDLLRPGRAITDTQKSVVEEIGLTFLSSGTGTSVHKMQVRLKSERAILSELELLGLIQSDWNLYYPTFPTLYFLPHSVRDGYATYLHYIFETIKVLYEDRGPGRLQIEEIRQNMPAPPEFARNASEEVHFQRAALFLRDFSQFVLAEGSPKPEIRVGAVVPTQSMIDYVDLQQAWKLELARKRPAYMNAPSANADQEERTPRQSKVGNADGIRSNWEIIGKPLGAGGQSTVYLARGPKRLNEREQDIETIHSFSPWGSTMHETRMQKTGEFANAVVDYARVESPTELGALKEFKLRDDEQQAINRLKQEVDVLRQGHPGLPRLLDFNINERWMVTEYFPGRTLEDNRGGVARTGHRPSRHKACKCFRSAR